MTKKERTKNKNGLSRYIPSKIRREVRQRCGFGCVRCGNPIYQYEHFDPIFAEATEHKAEGITLLCGGCHDKKTRGHISTNSIVSFNNNPKSRQAGFNRETFDITNSNQIIKLCGTTYVGIKTIIGIFDKEILSVHPPETDGAPIRISGLFFDLDGKMVLKIVNNEWISYSDSWDVEIEGPVITIRRKLGDIALQIRTIPPKTLIIEKIAMYYKGYRLEGEGGGLTISTPHGGSINYSGNSFVGNGNSIGLAITSNGIVIGAKGPFKDFVKNPPLSLKK